LTSIGRIAGAFALVLLWMAGPNQSGAAQLSVGSGSFDFPFMSAGASRRITVWYHRPAGAGADAPIVFVMHGQGRNGSTYRKYWIPFAEERPFVLLVPEFSRDEFPGDWNYNLGNMTTADGTRNPEAQWAYAAVEDIFDLVRRANGFARPRYDIYGHSAGGQFVHRLVLFKPDARYRVAVAANAGWYTMPDFGVAYPYGLGASGMAPARLAPAFARKLVVLLGDQDIDPAHRSLRRTPEALAQGEHRHARGHAFFERARHVAAEMNAPFAWTLHVAPGVGHSNARMAPRAAQFVGGSD
jgi:poly(3-hydroxybutyrate) depolymerase